MNGAPQRYTVEEVVAALHQSFGVVAGAARLLKCTRQTIYNYRDRYPEVREAMEEGSEIGLDVAELHLHSLIAKPDHPAHPRALIFYLERKGRRRGYGKALEMTGADGGPIETKNHLDLSKLSDAAFREVVALMRESRKEEGE